jgi:hypothetical protein
VPSHQGGKGGVRAGSEKTLQQLVVGDAIHVREQRIVAEQLKDPGYGHRTTLQQWLGKLSMSYFLGQAILMRCFSG